MSQESRTIKSFTDLYAWKFGHKLVIQIYKLTAKFPKEELFGLTNQIRRAAVSITSNIAEGFSRNSYKDKVQFYTISLGSLTEVHNQLLIARDIEYLNENQFKSVADLSIETNKLINGLIKKTKSIIHDS
jgi:four helix bundle protein